MSIKKVLKWFGIVVGSLLGLALIAVAINYLVIGSDLARTFDLDLTETATPPETLDLDEGKRLAQLRGCFFGCHGDETEGSVFFEVPDGTTFVAPDLALAINKYSAAELEKIVRHGVRPDGTSVLIPMPAEMFSYLSDRDYSLIVNFLATRSPGTEAHPDSHFGPAARLMLTMFKQDTGTILAAEMIDHGREHPATRPNDLIGLGGYLAMTTCTECHGIDLKGSADFAPTLAIVTAYSLEDFTTLMKTGVPIGGRELELMAEVALKRFTLFSDDEIAALHAYLSTLVES